VKQAVEIMADCYVAIGNVHTQLHLSPFPAAKSERGWNRDGTRANRTADGVRRGGVRIMPVMSTTVAVRRCTVSNLTQKPSSCGLRGLLVGRAVGFRSGDRREEINEAKR